MDICTPTLFLSHMIFVNIIVTVNIKININKGRLERANEFEYFSRGLNSFSKVEISGEN